MNSVNESLDAEQLYLKALRQAFVGLAQQLADKIERQIFKDSGEDCAQTSLEEASAPTPLKGLEQEMSAMRLTWASAHTALTQDLREVMVRFQEATPLQLGAQLKELRAGLESEIAHRREAEDMLTAKLRQFDEFMPPKSPEMISPHQRNYATVEFEEKQVAVVGLMSTPTPHDDFGRLAS